MSYLLESLGRGLLSRLTDAFSAHLPRPAAPLPELIRRHAEMPTSLDTAVQLGAAHLRELHLTDASSAFEHALRLDSGARVAMLGLACVWDERGHLDRSLDWLRRAAHADPQDPAVQFAIGFCHERLGEDVRAAEHYERANALCPTLRNALERRGALAIRGGRWDAAAGMYAALAELEPQNIDNLLTLGAIELNAGRAQAAIERFQQALLVEPEAAADALDTAAVFETDTNLRSALDACEQLVQAYPGAPELRVHLADLYVRCGDDQAAVAQYRAALRLRPDLLEATIKLGTQHLRQRRYLEAAECFNRAAELNDRLLTAFVGLGVAQAAAGRPLDAQATFDLAVSLAPNTTLLFAETTRLHRRAWGGAATGAAAFRNVAALECAETDTELDQIVDVYERTARRCPQCAELPYRLGLLLRQMGQLQRSIDALRTAVRVNPSFSKAQIKLGAVLREAGCHEEAAAAFDRAVRLNADGVEVHYQLGLLFAQRGQFEALAEDYERQFDDLGGDFAFRYTLLLGLQNIGMVDRAAATWDLLCAMVRHPDGQPLLCDAQAAESSSSPALPVTRFRGRRPRRRF